MLSFSVFRALVKRFTIYAFCSMFCVVYSLHIKSIFSLHIFSLQTKNCCFDYIFCVCYLFTNPSFSFYPCSTVYCIFYSIHVYDVCLCWECFCIEYRVPFFRIHFIFRLALGLCFFFYFFFYFILFLLPYYYAQKQAPPRIFNSSIVCCSCIKIYIRVTDLFFRSLFGFFFFVICICFFLFILFPVLAFVFSTSLTTRKNRFMILCSMLYIICS